MRYTHTYGTQTITIAINEVAPRTDISALIYAGDAVLLATVVTANIHPEQFHFFPLTVHYQERSYANGIIPNNYFRREMRPNDKEVLISRLIDRSIRPMFPNNWLKEIQITITTLSFDQVIPVEMIALIGILTMLNHQKLITEKLAAVKIKIADNQLMVNPIDQAYVSESLNLTVVGTKEHIVMIDAEADFINYSSCLEAIKKAQECITQEIACMESTSNQEQEPCTVYDHIHTKSKTLLSKWIEEFFTTHATEVTNIHAWQK